MEILENFKRIKNSIEILEGVKPNFLLQAKNELKKEIVSRVLWDFIVKSLKMEKDIDYKVIDKYETLDTAEQKALFTKAIQYLKDYFINFEKEKIYLISKNELKKAIDCHLGLMDIYSFDYYDLDLTKNIDNAYDIQNKHIIDSIARSRLFITARCGKNFCNINLGNYGAELYSSDVKDIYQFLLDSIEKINQAQPYFEFIWGEEK